MSLTGLRRLLRFAKGGGLRAQLVRGAVGLGGLKLISLPLTLAGSVLIGRVLGPAQYGQYAFTLAVVTILAIPFDQGMRALLTREVAAYHHDRNWAALRGLMRWARCAVAACSAVLLVLFGLAAAHQSSGAGIDRWVLLVLGALIIPVLGFSAIQGAALRGLGFVLQGQLPELLVRPGVHVLVAALLATVGLLRPATAIMSQVLASACALAARSRFLRAKLPAALRTVSPTSRRKEWVGAWVPFTLLMATGILNDRLGLLLVGWLSSDSQVGGLNVAIRGAQLGALPLVVVGLVIAPHITRAHREGDFRRLQGLYRRSAQAALAFALPVAVPLIIFATPILDFTFGAGYGNVGANALAILAAAQLLNVAFGCVGLFLVMTGFERETLLGQACALLVNVAMGLVLIPRLGATGAACSAATALMTSNVVFAVMLSRRLHIRPGVF